MIRGCFLFYFFCFSLSIFVAFCIASFEAFSSGMHCVQPSKSRLKLPGRLLQA
ncbi:hypothetical protein BDQ94DRAFT_148625 [Aspergillus welwitschiae]|uniref:Uncharacterized protein n=1 Tax=Aspergillus welwitschiae TaxID=1341132 RepID=A0A3F3PUH2_9EURO|nr:hypothetical protein BDQ94DRAFT_148625 [Aspergillus welwitschiae]RDH30525.1 hypothetical protein BDQ94DRAFT_148625 [Aspergillus welwitschiae]